MLNCLIVEDEPLAADVLVDYIQQLPFLKLKATCSNAMDALSVLQRESIDLVFLDIHLPGLKGLDFLKTLKNPPAVILTTAYHQYALQSYELNVVDYLLKPIEFTRFVEAVNKVKSKETGDARETIAVHADKKTVIIPIADILYIESQKEYIKIQTSTASIVTKHSLSKMEEQLSPARFLRIHRSFIVALEKITAFSGHEVDLRGKSIPIGGNYRETVSQKLHDFFT